MGAAPPSPQRWLLWQRNTILVGLWVAFLGALAAVHEVLLPFGVALLLAYVLHPAVTSLSNLTIRNRRAPRWVATLLLFAVMGLGMWGLAAVFVPQVSGEMAGMARETRASLTELDRYVREAPGQLNRVAEEWDVPVVFVWPPDKEPAKRPVTAGPNDLVVDLRAEVESLVHRLQSALVDVAGGLAARAQGLVGGVIGFVFRLFLVLMLTAFMLSDVNALRKTALAMVPAEKRESMDRLLDKLDDGLSGVVRGQITICLINGVLTLLGMVILKVKFGFLLSLVAGCMSLIPIFGSIASSVPIVAVALSDSLEKGLLALAWIVGIHLLEANLLNPKIMGSAAHIHPLLVVLSLITGEHFYGFTGALFAVPCLSVGLTMFKFLHARAMKLQGELGLDPETKAAGPPPAAP
ncbi:MAG: AI-2E family transporter [Deltaproteobacteria bacterium]|nr:AI-2E family transporter [Deltaproteobacteria bacterium]